MQAITTDTHPLSAASTSRDQLGGSSVARPAPALLPSDVPPPPHRPFNRDEALMDDALRSLPPAQQRGIMRRRAGSSASQPQLDLDLALSRTRTRNTEASDRSTHSAAGWRSWLAKRSSIAGPSSVRSVRRDSAETDHGVGQDGSSHQRRAHHARSKAARREERRARRESRRAQALAAQVNAEEHPSEQMATDPPVVEASAAPSPKLSVRLPAEPPGLLPTALAKPSKLRKPRQRLQFAPEQRKVRREYLPEDYEAGDDYRGFDEFVEAARSRRRRERRQALGDPRRRKGSRSSKSSRSSVASSDGNSSDSSSSPSSSSGSSASGHGLSMARLRAWFGDSSSSDSSSSSSSTSSDSSSDSSSPSSDGARSRISRSRSRISGRGGRARRRRSASRHRSEMGEYARPDSPTVFGLRAASSFGPLSEYAMKGGAKRHRRRKAVRRARQRELRLIEQGIITPGMSMSNRAKAAQEASGRVSEFTLFTPVALPLTPVEAQAARPSLGRRGMTNQRVPLKEQSGDDVLQGTLSGKVLRTTAFAEVKSRLLTLQQFGRQLDRQDGDLGVANEKPVDHAERDATEAHGAHVTPVRRDAGYHSEMRPELASRRSVSAQDPHPEWEDELDVGDLALPPPALDLRVPDKDKPDELFSPGHHDDEGATGLHMSDVPLSPQMRHHFRADLFRLTPRRPFASPRPSHHSHHSYHSGPKSPGGERTRAESEASCIAPSATDPEHVSEQTEEGDIAVDTQEVPDRGSSEDATKVGLASVPESPPATGAGTWWLDVSCPTYRDMRELSKVSSASSLPE